MRSARVDHLVYATPDLDRGIAEIERLLGVRASPGGHHPGRGTCNALVSLGPAVYLEIVAPDPGQPAPAGGRLFAVDQLTRSRLVTWAANGDDLENMRSAAARVGVTLGAVEAGSRRRPDGVLLCWHFTDPATTLADGIVPFFIDWGDSPHPARVAPSGATLAGLRAEHPDPENVHRMLQLLGLDLSVQRGEEPALIAILDGARGRVELR